MKQNVEMFRTAIGSVILPATILDPSLRRSPVRGAVVVGCAVMFGILVVGTAVVYKNVILVRDYLSGNKMVV